MGNNVLPFIALALGVIGLGAGAAALWGLFLFRRQVLGSSPSVEQEVIRLRELVEDVGQGQTAIVDRLGGLEERAVQFLHVENYGRPGDHVGASVLVVLRQGTRGRSGVLLHSFGDPQFRVLVIDEGQLRVPAGGAAYDKEREVVARLVPQEPARPGRGGA